MDDAAKPPKPASYFKARHTNWTNSSPHARASPFQQSKGMNCYTATPFYPYLYLPMIFFFYFFFLSVSTSPSCLFVSSLIFSLTLSPPPHFLQLQHFCLNVPMHHCHTNICLVTQDTIALYIQYTWGKSCYVPRHGQLVV